MSAKRTNVKDEFECSICLDAISTDPSYTNPCGHTFCYNCVNDWLSDKSTCPICRETVSSVTKILESKDASAQILKRMYIDLTWTCEDCKFQCNVLKREDHKKKCPVYNLHLSEEKCKQLQDKCDSLEDTCKKLQDKCSKLQDECDNKKTVATDAKLEKKIRDLLISRKNAKNARKGLVKENKRIVENNLHLQEINSQLLNKITSMRKKAGLHIDMYKSMMEKDEKIACIAREKEKIARIMMEKERAYQSNMKEFNSISKKLAKAEQELELSKRDNEILKKSLHKANSLCEDKMKKIVREMKDMSLTIDDVKKDRDNLKNLVKVMELALKGNPVAQYRLAEYYKGRKQLKKAVEWYQKAADKGHTEAQFELGSCHFNGEGVTKDYKQAVEWYQKAADKGHAQAQYTFGGCYYIGLGVTKDYKQAVEWYQKAVAKGYTRAQYSLGFCYYYGLGVTQDYKQAFEWYQKAADKGHTEAQFYLGRCYYYGYGVTEDDKQAFKWYQKAADKGHAEAQHMVDELLNM